MASMITVTQILGINMEGTTGFLIRFLLTLITLFLLVRLLYYEYRKEGIPEYLFAFFLLGIIVFLICTALEMVQVELGFALGLFALFGILRFRTESIPVREMTYLFLVIGIAMINSLVDFIDPINGIVLSNTMIIIPAWVLEAFLSRNNIKKQEIVYDNLEDVFAGDEVLIEKITEVTGYAVKKIRILKVDIMLKKANVLIFYKEK
jgi:uncharacterized membrane protein